MITVFLTTVSLQLAFVFGSYLPLAIPESSFKVTIFQKGNTGFKVREPNLYSPDLYAENIDFIATLVKLPGATKKQSYWELSYQLYFIPEEQYYESLRRLPKGGSNPQPEAFSGRILLAEGHKKKTRLSTLKERTITLNEVPFKQKVPDVQRTKFAYLMTAYSVKIFDAELNTTAYRSGIFLTNPYEAKTQDQRQAIARKTIYLNFGINPDGTLNGSQLPPRTGETQ